MRVTINIETKALLTCAAANWVAHFYFTLLPLAIDEVKSFRVALLYSFGVALLWLYGAKRKSTMVLLFIIPLAWFFCYYSLDTWYGAKSIIDEASVERLTLGKSNGLTTEFNFDLTTMLLSGISLLVYLVTTLFWLELTPNYKNKSALIKTEPLYLTEVDHTASPPNRMLVIVIAYWLIALILSLQFWLYYTGQPDRITSENFSQWIQFCWVLAIFNLTWVSAYLLLKEYSVLLVGLGLEQVEDSLRSKLKVYFFLILGLILMLSNY